MAGRLLFYSDLDYGARCSLCGRICLCRAAVDTKNGDRLKVCPRCWRATHYRLSTQALADIEEAAWGLDLSRGWGLGQAPGEDYTGKELE